MGAQIGKRSLDHLGPDLFAIDGEATVPGEMVQAEGVERAALGGDRRVEDTFELTDDRSGNPLGNVTHANGGDVRGVA